MIEAQKRKVEEVKQEAERVNDDDVQKQTNLDNQEMKQFSIKQREFLPYELKTTKLLSKKQKIANYEDADYCFITSKKTIALLLMELRPLFERGGVYYKIYNKIDEEDDFNKSPKDVKK